MTVDLIAYQELCWKYQTFIRLVTEANRKLETLSYSSEEYKTLCELVRKATLERRKVNQQIHDIWVVQEQPLRSKLDKLEMHIAKLVREGESPHLLDLEEFRL